MKQRQMPHDGFASLMLMSMSEALASPNRQQGRTVIQQGMGPFTGRVYHLIQEEN